MQQATLSTLEGLTEAPEVPVNVSLAGAPLELKVALLKELGMRLHEDGTHVVNENGTKVIDPYVNEWVRIDRMMILPGSIMVLDDNLVSVACYMEEHGDGL